MKTLDDYRSTAGKLIPIFKLEIHTRPDDANRLLDAISAVEPLAIGRYRRNATVSAVGAETGQPGEDSVTRIHNDDFSAGEIEVYPSVQLKISIDRDVKILQKVVEAILHAHQYEEPLIYISEEWASRANYRPDNDNPNRWWDDGRGTPPMIEFDQNCQV